MKRLDLVTLLERALEDMEEENDLITKQVLKFLTTGWFHIIILIWNRTVYKVFQSEKIHREYQTLQDLNFALEIEHCDHLQDMDSLESQLKKYQYLFNVNEVFF